MSLPICYNRTETGRCVIGCGSKCKYGYVQRVLAFFHRIADRTDAT